MEIQSACVLITGASKGIGAATARSFAKQGAHVILAARSRADIEQLAQQLNGSSFSVDLTDSAQLDGFIERVEHEISPIDILINNAGLETQDFVEDIEESKIEDVLATNLVAPIRLTRQALPRMIERGRGHLVYTSSMAAITPAPGLAAYCASKAGLSRFAETVRMETKGTGVEVTTMHLGPVNTEMWDRVTRNPAFDQAQRRLRQMRLLADVSAEKVATDVTRAVIRQKREVRHPKRLWGTMALAALPGRITELLVSGVDHRFHKRSD